LVLITYAKKRVGFCELKRTCFILVRVQSGSLLPREKCQGRQEANASKQLDQVEVRVHWTLVVVMRAGENADEHENDDDNSTHR
jgi:hypothetical protein